MNKFVSTVILTAFTAVCSFGAIAGSHDSDKKDTMGSSSSSSSAQNKNRDDRDKEPKSTSDVMKNQMPRDLPPGVKNEYRDQEVMDKKPYKQ
jgi:hypothetical protein